MAYTINLTNGTIFTTVNDGTIDQTSSMTLVGKNYAGYGEFLDENFVHLLENSANSTAPGDPLTGQLWFDSSTGTIKVYNGTLFKSISGARSSASTPTSNATGDLWWDTTNDQLKVYNGSTFTTIGPAFTSGEGTSGAIVDTVTDTSLVDHVVVKMFVNNTIVAIFSKDSTFTPGGAGVTGFPTIAPGLQLATTGAVAGILMTGTASDSNLLEGNAANAFMTTSGSTTNDTDIRIQNDTGLYVGGDADGRFYVSGTDVYVENQTSDGNLIFRVNDGGSATTVLNIDGASSTMGTLGITNLNANGVGNIGSASGYFNTIFAKATSAQYADLAERFASDDVYPAGTVVQLGGSEEVTICIQDASDDVFGVISTNPAFTMNGGAGEDDTHPAIAMTGRVPVRVTGTVTKGDRLVCAGEGRARSALPSEVTAFNVIGRSLEDKLDTGEGTVEAIVKIN